MRTHEDTKYISDVTVSVLRYNNVVIFGVEQMMPELEAKLAAELGPGSRVVACRFRFPTWTPVTEIGSGVDTVWTYQR